MKRILLTGANGLLGRSLCRSLSQQGQHVYALTRVIPSDPLPGITYCPVDLSANWCDDALPNSVDAVVHLAQSAKFRDFPESATDIFRVNIESAARLLDYAKRVSAHQFIYASSGGVYGNGATAFHENSPIVSPGQLGYYLGSKMCGEILVQSYAAVMQVVVLRPFFIYGSGQNRSMLIPRLMDNIVAGRPISLSGERGIRINPIHVEDAACSIAAALSINGSATFNIAGPNVMSIHEICEGMGRYVGRTPVFHHQGGTSNDLIADITAMRAKLHMPKLRLLENLGDVCITTKCNS
jgi:UDP-glucose 4-epimerase